jgi:hypothetical protein
LLEVVGVEVEWRWVDSDTIAHVNLQGVIDRTAGSGKRVASYSVDGNSPTDIQPTTNTVSISILMNSPHQLTVILKKQFQVTIAESVDNSLAFVTPPSIAGDDYWYDKGTAVSVVMNSIIERESEIGTRLESYVVNGVTYKVISLNPISVISTNSIESPQSVSGTTTKQVKFTSNSGELESLTSPSLEGDSGWYDQGTGVTAAYSYSWNLTSDNSRMNALGYSINQGPLELVDRSGIGVFTIRIKMSEPKNIEIASIKQYALEFRVDSRSILSSLSPTADEFFDSETELALTANYVENQTENTRQSLIGYAFDGVKKSIDRSTSGTYSPPLIKMDKSHKFIFETVTQYLVNFNFTDSLARYEIVPDNF